MKIIRYIVIVAAVMSGCSAFAQVDKTIDAPITEPRIIRGTDAVIAPPKASAIAQGSAAGLKFEDAPLADVVHVVLREIVKVNYIIHPPIVGSVTLSTQGNVSADDALLLLEYALQANGYLMAQDTRGTYHIGRPEVIKGIVPAVRQAVKNTPLPSGYGAVIVSLKYIGATEMAAILGPLSAPGSILRVDTVRNLLVLMGSRTQAEGWLDLVATFDVDLLKGMSVGVFPLKYITAKEVEAALRLMSGGSVASPAASASSTPAGPGTGAAAESALASPLPSSFPLYGALRVVPIDRLNSVMVVTPRAEYLDEARRWIEKLDKPGLNTSEAQLFVYPVQNGSAVHLANVLSGLFGSSTASATTGSSGVAPGLTQVTGTTTGTTASASSGTSTALSSNAGRSSIGGTGLTTVNMGSGMRVIADEINNAVLVYATPAEFSKVEAALKRLDVPPTQIMIEASIIEVTLSDDLKYGLQWIFDDKARNGLSGTGVLSTAASATLGATPAGFSYTLSNSVGDVRAVLNALATKSLLKVISSPSLMVLDNHTASIVVGQQQPVQMGTTITTGGTTSTNIAYKDTGVSLSVTPSVNAGNMVTMLISQSVSDVGDIDTATSQRSFLQRQISSKVAVRSGETLILGGLIRDNTTNGKSGLPVLQDIPLLGNLFGATTKSINRTELLVIITPQVVRSDQDLRELSTDLRLKMKNLDWGWANARPIIPAAKTESEASSDPKSIH